VRSLAALCAAAAVASVCAAAPAGARAAPAAGANAAPGAVQAPSLSVTAAALIDERSGRQLYALNAGARLPIASTTKLMTALLTLERVRRLSTMFTQTDYYPAAVDSQIGLVPGERMSVHDLLLALLLPSADDAAQDLAYNVGRHSVAFFVAMMNVRARELGLRHTHYSTPSGLDTPGNYSSASDLVTLARWLLLHHPFFAHAVDLASATLQTGDAVRHVVNTNDLVGHGAWINGVKTGHTADAGYVLIGSGTRDGITLISAVLGTDSESARDANTLALLDWGFANFHSVRPLLGGRVLARLPVQGQSRERVGVIAARTLTEVVAKTARVRVRLVLPRQLTAPRARHAVVGTAVVLAGSTTLARVPLLLAQRLSAPATSATLLITRPFTLVPLVLLLAVAAVFILRRREHSRRSDAPGPEPA
jgi:D-alanyl-D-alanine carboxypeptidase (penicillin-binding protein 5/6)